MHKIRNSEVLVLIFIMCAMFLYFCHATLFNTKGEPREAIVALTMLKSGDWILPCSFGADIPYKPPFLAWCIAGFSLLFGGEVNEFTSRLPSVLASIIMVIATCRFFGKYGKGELAGFITAFITVTSIEVFRASTACRVDMLLAMFVVCALYSLYGFIVSGKNTIPWVAVLLMSGAVLTKGPVGIVLPLFIAWLFAVITGYGVWRITWRVVVCALLAAVIPSVWYMLAASEGGSQFVSLMMEENIGRFTGSMGYASHENPWYYNLITLLVGMLPYTIFILLALIAGKLNKQSSGVSKVTLFALVSSLVVLIFFTIPKSKRSVYLLPMYPFLAYFTSLLMEWVWRMRKAIFTLFVRILCVVAIGVGVAYILFVAGVADNLLPINIRECKLSGFGLYFGVVLAMVLIVCGIHSWRNELIFKGAMFNMVTVVSALMIFVNCIVLPPVLNAKSDKPIAEYIKHNVKADIVYSYVESPMLRFYTTGFYTNDGLWIFNPQTPPKEGYLVVGCRDFEKLEAKLGTYIFKVEKSFEGKSCDVKQPVLLVRFDRMNLQTAGSNVKF